MKLVYSNENKIFVDNMKNVLNLEGITCEVKNEYAGSASGDLAPFDTWPELWVIHPEQHKKAENVLKKLRIKKDEIDWKCLHCEENNGASFELCWRCGQDKE